LANVLIFSDLHLTQNSLVECKEILDEIITLCNQYVIDNVIDLGDTFDNIKPASSELDLFSSFIKKLNRPITILAANSHESESEVISIINHFGLLNEMVTVVKEYKDGNHLFCGHFIVKEAKKNFSTTISKYDLKYKYVFLGHQHSYEIIKPNICQLGSCRYVNFDEAGDKQKVIVIIENYKEEKEKVIFLPIKSAIPMVQLELKQNSSKVDVESASKTKKDVPERSVEEIDASNEAISAFCQKLDKLSPKTKVKVSIKDFTSFREFLPFVNKYIFKFNIFKYVTDFTVVTDNTQKDAKTEIINFKESFTKWLFKQEIDVKIKDILLKEIE